MTCEINVLKFLLVIAFAVWVAGWFALSIFLSANKDFNLLVKKDNFNGWVTVVICICVAALWPIPVIEVFLGKNSKRGR